MNKSFSIFVVSWLLIIAATVWFGRDSQGVNEIINTNITARITSCVAVSSDTIMLNMEATTTDGLPITKFSVYQDGVWIADVPVPAPVPGVPPPTNFQVRLPARR